MIAKEKAIAEIEKIISSIEPVNDEMRSVIFYLKVAENYIFHLYDDDYLAAKIEAYEEVLAMFGSHSESSVVAATVKAILDIMKEQLKNEESETDKE